MNKEKNSFYKGKVLKFNNLIHKLQICFNNFHKMIQKFFKNQISSYSNRNNNKK